MCQSNFAVKRANKRAVFAKLGESLPLSDEEFDLTRNNTNIHIVVSHCEEHVNWIAQYIGPGYNVKNITIFSKCNRKIRGLDELTKFAHVQVIRLDNVGRCDHTYAYWIAKHYKEIQDNVETEGDDVVLFLKDNKRFRRLYYNFKRYFTFLTDVGFGCVKKPECDCSIQCTRWRLMPNLAHNKSYVLDFSLDEYKRVHRDENHEFLNEKYHNLKSWRDDMNLALPSTPSMPVCYGGMFGVKRKHILNQPLSVWESVMKSLERGDNIIEGHYAERMWAGILTDHNEVDNRVADEILTPEVWDMVKRPDDGNVCGMAGMYYVRRSTNMTEHIRKHIGNYTTY